MLKKLLILSLCAISIDAYSYAKARVVDMSVPFSIPKNRQVPVSTRLEYGIQNNTYDPQVYTVAYSLCPENKDCYRNSFPVYLASTQRVQNIISAGIPVSYRQKGTYTVTASIQITGESTHYAQQFRSITITD
jgi:hypothetical protein